MEMFPKLQEIQERYGCLPMERLIAVSEETGIPVGKLISVASFYSFFSFEPVAADHIENLYPCREAGSLLRDVRDYSWRALEIARSDPEAILPRVAEAGLLGRSGGGFPVAKKWEITKNASADIKYVVCNADEGEPGTGKDRVLLERSPNAVIEGMAICALAVGAKKGYVYLRGEYADLAPSLEAAIAAAPLGEFKIELRLGHGAYVCGDETALLNSLENKRGETRLKPPYPGTAGLYGKPTVVNNVESFACVPYILNVGEEAFRAQGVSDYAGPKLYTVCGAVKLPGVYEGKAGVTIGELLDRAGGAASPLKGVLVGGGSGSLATPDCLDVPMTPASCREHGLTFGTASLRFIGEDENLLSVVRELTEFFSAESCGTCVPCRVGLRRLADLLRKAEEGNVYPEELAEIGQLAAHIRASARCALGQAAVTPVLTLIQNFPEVLK